MNGGAITLALYLTASVTAAGVYALAPPAPRAIDGDTIAIGRERIRIMGMDAPELHPARCDLEQQMGEDARNRLALLIEGELFIERLGRDAYHRTLAIVVVIATSRNIATTMIEEGFARPYAGGQREPWCPQ